MAEDLRYIKTDHLLKTALVDLLDRKSFAQITVNDLCQQAQVGRSTFYHHYVDKYALLSAEIDQTTAEFQNLVNSRNTQLTDDEFLIYLYQQLFSKRQSFLRLLAVKSPQSDLESNLKEILKKASYPVLQQMNLNLPIDFLTDMYSSTALNAITWTLKNGHSSEIAAFMNNSLKQLLPD